MFAPSADAKTSASAPSLICPTRSDEDAKLNFTFAPGFDVLNASPISVNASVNDAAANTVTSPDTVDPAGAAVAPAGLEVSSAHDADTNPRKANVARTRLRDLRMSPQ